ncbi:MAG: hypothetical protein ACYDGR_00630 [Candidatus Dormibacteria bacterium]
MTPPFRRLPITVDRLTPARGLRRPWHAHSLASTWHRFATAAGVMLALLGAWIANQPPLVTAGFSGTSYVIEGARLEASGAGAYGGPAALVVVSDGSGDRAASSALVNGVKVRGLCFHGSGQASERCIFMVGKRSISAVDRRDGSGWLRRYDDGEQVVIHLLGNSTAPVPFLVGYHGA